MMTAGKTDKYMETAHSPRTTWKLWRSPSSHIEAWAAVIWRKTSLGRRGQRVGEQRCHNSERNGWLPLHWQPTGTVLKNYNSSELDWSGCPTTGSDVPWRHQRAASCFPLGDFLAEFGEIYRPPRVTTHLARVSSHSALETETRKRAPVCCSLSPNQRDHADSSHVSPLTHVGLHRIRPRVYGICIVSLGTYFESVLTVTQEFASMVHAISNPLFPSPTSNLARNSW